jgi:hypothetical protein
MQPIYHQIRRRARQIILRHPTPDFYHDHGLAYEASKKLFDSDLVVKKLLSFVAGTLEDDFGHGLMHAVKVSHDAGTLVHIEAQLSGYDKDRLCRLVCLVQTAGLLHDIKRKRKDHSAHAATYAKKVLKKYPFSPEEIENICTMKLLKTISMWIHPKESCFPIAFMMQINFAGARIISTIPFGTWYPILTHRWTNLWMATPRVWRNWRRLKPLSERRPGKNLAPNLSISVWRLEKNFMRS